MSVVYLPFHLLFSVFAVISSQASESIYLVTSPDDHCPWEFTADKSCLTLEQYALNPILGSNSSLRLVSGSHLLTGRGLLFDGYFDSVSPRNSFFTMTADGGEIVYSSQSDSDRPLSGRDFLSILAIRHAQYVEIKGLSFVGNAYGHITIEDVQEARIELCSFDRVQVRIRNVDSVHISRSIFSNYSHPKDIHIISLCIEDGALVVSESTVAVVQSNFTLNQGAIHYDGDGLRLESDTIGYEMIESHSLQIQGCVFTNNTSLHRGSALQVTGSASVSVSGSVFIFNAANISGAAVYFSGGNDSTDLASSIVIATSTFLFNSAGFCGAFHIDNRNGQVEVRDSVFYYNGAVSSGGGIGGAGCIRNASLLISNCSFVANSATAHAGALDVDESRVRIDNCVFNNNTANRDGGALFTYVHSTDYVITNSFFSYNKAGDDGGAVFVGKKGSTVLTERCNIYGNEANDRGGAICVIGTTLNVSHTSIYGNGAGVGKQISACNSFVSTFISGRNDPNYPNCHIYDNDIVSNSYNTPTPYQKNYWNGTWVNKTVDDIVTAYVVFSDACSGDCSKSSTTDSAIKRLAHKAAVVAYVSLAVSVTTASAIIMCIVVLKLRHCKIRRKRQGEYHLLSTQDDQAGSDDEELLDHVN